MATIVSLDPIHFTFNISEANFLAYQRAEANGLLASLRGEGVPAFVRLADETEWKHEGAIDFMDNEVDLSSGTIAARGRFANADGLFTPGQFGRIRVPGSERYTAILAPESAVLTDQSQKIVLAVEPDNTVAVRIVRLGPPYDGLRIVREGLKPDDRIIINGLTRVRPGMVVNPEPGQIAAGL
jgi:RND family efflux transporter MFP subunit